MNNEERIEGYVNAEQYAISGITSREISNLLQVHLTTVSSTLGRLTRNGRITRRQEDNVGRLVKYRYFRRTAEAATPVEILNERIDALEAQIVAVNDLCTMLKMRLDAYTPVSQIAKATVPATVPRAIRPKVLIVGLLDSQMSLISAEHKDKLDIWFIGSDATKQPGSWKHRIPGIGDGYIIVMTKFASHAVFKMVRSHKKLILLNGGLTDLRNRLKELEDEL